MSSDPDSTTYGDAKRDAVLGRMRAVTRMVVMVLAFGQFAVAAVMAGRVMRAKTDAAGDAMMVGFATVATLVVLLFGVPALLLATKNKHLKTALILSLVFPVGLLYMTTMG